MVERPVRAPTAALVAGNVPGDVAVVFEFVQVARCLLYTSDAADELLCVDLGGRRVFKKIICIHPSHIAMIREGLYPFTQESEKAKSIVIQYSRET